MNERDIFALALGLKDTPWEVTEVKLDPQASSLEIYLDFAPGSRFPRRSDGRLCPVYDTQQKTWRHLNFFQYQCFVHAWVPRIDGGEPDGVQLVEVPWARPASGFTLLMEALMALMCQTAWRWRKQRGWSARTRTGSGGCSFIMWIERMSRSRSKRSGN